MKNLKLNEAAIIIGAQNKCMCQINDHLSIESQRIATIDSCSHDCCIAQGAISFNFYDSHTKALTSRLCDNERPHLVKRAKEIMYEETLYDFQDYFYGDFYNSSARQ